MQVQEKETIHFSWWDLLKSFWYFLEGKRFQFIFWTVTLFIVFFYQLVPPFIIGKIVDFFSTYKTGDSLNTFYFYVGGYGISYALVALIRLQAKNKTANLGSEMAYEVKVQGFEKLLDFSLSWHDKENSGNKVQRIQQGAQAIEQFRKVMSQQGFDVIAAMAGTLLVFLFLDIKYLLFLLVYLFIFILLNKNFYNVMHETQIAFNKALERASGTYYEGLSNVLTLKTLGAKDSFKQNVYGNEQVALEFRYKMQALGTGKWRIFQLFNAFSMTVYLLFLGHDLVNSAITVGAIIIYFNYLRRMIDAAGDSTDVFEKLIEAKAAIGRMMPIYWEQEAVEFGDKPFPQNWTNLIIKNGYFSYPQIKKDKPEKIAIENLNFSVQKYEKIGIAGASGGGKSTLAKVLLGLYPLEKGTFTINDTNFYDIKHADVTKHIAIVLQDSEMFNLTMKENITLMREVSSSLLQKAISIAQLEELIQRLPDGLETLIGEKGYRLSGGERQRLGIARAICKDPDILVLDEATSALDSRTERNIQEALETELQKKTLIIIAHRVSTLQNVDRICVFDHGQIVEQGTYDELMKNPQSKFYEVYQVQKKEKVLI